MDTIMDPLDSNQLATKTCSNLQLKKYVDLAEGLEGLPLQNVIIQALEANGLFVFAELRGVDSVKKMEVTNTKYWKLLNIFTYGTLQTYKEQIDQLPQLSAQMVKKLQILTLMTLASDKKFLSYEKLIKELCVDNIRELEDLLISAVYEDLIRGRLDQLNSRLEIDWSAGRDVQYNDMLHIISTLNSWCGGCEKILTNIEDQVLISDCALTEEKKRVKDFTNEFDTLLATIRRSTSSTNSLLTSQTSLMTSVSQQEQHLRLSGGGQPTPSSGGTASASGEQKSKKSKVKTFRNSSVKLWSSKN